MDHAACHIVYVDSRMSQALDGRQIPNVGARHNKRDEGGRDQQWEPYTPESLKMILGEIEEIRATLRGLLSHFNVVHTCRSGRTCMSNLRKLDTAGSDETPLLVLSTTILESDNEFDLRDASSRSSSPSPSPDSEGLSLIQHLANEIATSNLSKLVIPIALLSGPVQGATGSQTFSDSHRSRPPSWGIPSSAPRSSESRSDAGRDLLSRNTLKCLDAGAVDVLRSPLREEGIHRLTVRVYRTYKDAQKERIEATGKKRSRKLSWLGNTENKPYAYLREKMVSELMTGICNPEEHLHLGDQRSSPALDPARKIHLQHAIASWDYSGHDYSEEELIHAAGFMLQHALTLPELEKWRLSPSQLTTFLMASRAAYNDFVDYHNFRHVIDVMQAIFYFLIQLGTLPEYPTSQPSSLKEQQKGPVATLLKPFDALTLLITAIGHDVGHPGVNNAFLVALNAPLAQLYNDKSVLEAFHCAAYSQILRRYWSAAFEDLEMRSLMINSILATDMGVHQKYMTDLGNLQEKLYHQQGIDGFNAQQLEEYRILTCALLVKCADISNVARPFDTAMKWANILQLEFANQGVMEQDVGIPTTLFGGPPELGNLVKLGQSQNSFMNFFARPLFEAVADILPDMGFAVDEIQNNQIAWTEKIRIENEKEPQRGRSRDSPTGALSPRSRSPIKSGSQPELSHPEGLPASSPSPEPLLNLTKSQPALPSHLGRLSEPTTLVHSHALNDLTLPSKTVSHCSSTSNQVQKQNHITDPTSDFSCPSSGGVSNTSSPSVATAPRRASGSSPSQLRLTPDQRSRRKASITASENILPNGRHSEDTLLQIGSVDGQASTSDGQRSSENFDTGKGAKRLESKGNEQPRPSPPTTYQGTTRSQVHCVHHRTSSGAHTNNTNGSQSTPYSPTETQATSVLTVESDETSLQSRMNSWPERNGASSSQVNNGPVNLDHFSSLARVGGGAKDIDVKTSVLSNGSVRSSDLGYRSIGKKNSRFNIFHWKRKASRMEASP